MKRLVYIIFGAWVALCIILKIFGLVGWGFALSFIWFPSLLTLTVGAGVFLVADHMERAKGKIPHTCDNCLFKSAADIISDANGEKKLCVGRRLGDVKDNTCPHFVMDRQKEAKIPFL